MIIKKPDHIRVFEKMTDFHMCFFNKKKNPKYDKNSIEVPNFDICELYRDGKLIKKFNNTDLSYYINFIPTFKVNSEYFDYIVSHNIKNIKHLNHDNTESIQFNEFSGSISFYLDEKNKIYIININEKKLNNIMVDIETLGNGSGSVITSIAAVAFDIETGDLGREFYVEVDIQNSINNGLKIDGSTIKWWLKQSEDVRKLIYDQIKPLALSDALDNFYKFIHSASTRDDAILWGNSARFDLGIISDAYKIMNKNIPWKYSNERCVRTLVSLNPKIKEEMKFIGVKHNPIDDCKHQIKYCSEIFKTIKVGV